MYTELTAATFLRVQTVGRVYCVMSSRGKPQVVDHGNGLSIMGVGVRYMV